MPCSVIMLVNSRKAIRNSNSTVSSVRCSASVRLPFVFSASIAHQVDGLASSQNIHARALALLGPGPHLDHRRNVQLLDQVLKAHRWLSPKGRVLRPDQVFQPLRGGVVCGFLFATLFCRRRRRQIHTPLGSTRIRRLFGSRLMLAFGHYQPWTGGRFR